MGSPAMSPPTGADTRGGGIRRWLHRVRVAVGLAAAPAPATLPVPADRGTQLAEQRTRLAIKRSFLAAERTLMAWVRTSLSMISFGFTMVKFFEYLEAERNLTRVVRALLGAGDARAHADHDRHRGPGRGGGPALARSSRSFGKRGWRPVGA